MKKILLVNSSRYFFDEGKSLLDRKDFQVLLAPTAMKALLMHREEKVNLIVADMELQDISGDMLCARLREDSESRAVSFILVCHNAEQMEKGTRHGANICLKRPFPANEILGHVEKMLAISVRKGYRVLLRAKVKGSKDDTVFFCTSQNLSVSGILIETDRSLAVGDLISCSFYLPGSAHISAEGEVARIENSDSGKLLCGVRFTTLDTSSKNAIEEFISDSALAVH